MAEINNLIEIMRRLREPETGCPWDCAQSYASIVPHTIEEAYEVADAIARGDLAELKDELGDLLFQVIFYAQIACEQGIFDFDDVVKSISAKMVRRHPHVFGNEVYSDEEQQNQAWEQIKAAERAASKDAKDSKDVKSAAKTPDLASALDHVPLALPALTRAIKLQKKAARVGFDWTEPVPVLAKIQEELDELNEAIATPDKQTEIEEEYGDLLFACSNLARFLKLDPETVLRAANAKFERRFRSMEMLAIKAGDEFNNLTLIEQERLWETVKVMEKKRQGTV